MKHFLTGLPLTLTISMTPPVSEGADLEVLLANAPGNGTLVFQVYDAADVFGDLLARRPKK